MKTRVLGTVAAIVIAGQAHAGPEYLGSFRPVAAEESARAVWVNPAAVGILGLPAAAADFVLPHDARRGALAISMLRAAYGIQGDFSDEKGLPDWTFAWARRLPVAGRLALGVGLEWRGGPDSGLDGSAGAFLPGNTWSLGGAVYHLLQPETEETKALRTWQLGGAWRPSSMMGRFTYDAVLPAESDTQHWFGVAFDRTSRVRLAFAMSTAKDWSAGLDLVLGDHRAGGGAREPDGEKSRGFAAWEWTGRAERSPRSHRAGFRD